MILVWKYNLNDVYSIQIIVHKIGHSKKKVLIYSKIWHFEWKITCLGGKKCVVSLTINQLAFSYTLYSNKNTSVSLTNRKHTHHCLQTVSICTKNFNSIPISEIIGWVMGLHVMIGHMLLFICKDQKRFPSPSRCNSNRKQH